MGAYVPADLGGRTSPVPRTPVVSEVSLHVSLGVEDSTLGFSWVHLSPVQ